MGAGYSRPRIQRVALTHLHFDHIAGLHDLLWAGWIQSWWDEPPPIVGPPGTREFIAGLMQAFSYDIKVRTMGERRREGLVPSVVEEMEEGWTVGNPNWRLSAFRVEHQPVDQAFGFRLDSDDGSIVISGDTRRSENLIRHSRGVDLLLHEVYWAEGMRKAISAATSCGHPGPAQHHRRVPHALGRGGRHCRPMRRAPLGPHSPAHPGWLAGGHSGGCRAAVQGTGDGRRGSPGVHRRQPT